jgi:hypothetical protein
MMMMMREEESKEEEREKEFDEKEKKKSSVDDERSRLKSNDDESQNEDGSSSVIPESVLKEFEEFLLLLKNNENVTNSFTFSETQLSLPVRVLIHQMVKEKGKNMLGSRTISETNQIRAFRKKDYFSNKEGDEDKEEDKEEEQQRTRFERGNIELNDAFDFFLELKLKTKNGGRSSSSSLKINADVARSKYHKLSQRLHPSYDAASSGRMRGWCDQCGMLLELGRWYRFTTTTGSRSRSGEKDEQNGGETADDLTDICRVCLEKKKKKNVRRNFSTNKGRRDETENAYLEMEKNGELVLIKDLSAFGEKGSELREMYCCSLNDDESDDEREKSNNNHKKKKTTLLTRAHKATLGFKKLTVAYLCFKDPSRTEIYKTFGFDQLKKHEENYSDVNIFECDPWEVYEDFFEGKDEDDRQYLLFNGVDLESSDSDLEENMMVEEEAEEEKEEEEEDMDDDSEEDLNLLKQAKEMAKQQQQQQKKVIMSKSTSANEVLKFPFYQPGGVGGTHNRFVDNDDNEEDDEKKEDIWSTTISKAAV